MRGDTLIAMTKPHPSGRRTGRRPGEAATRGAIVTAALGMFAEHGYDAASLRAIAARADVDPALIRYFFTDKQTLFVTAMADRSLIADRLAAAVRGDPARAGERMTDAYLHLWEDEQTRPIVLGLARSAMTSRHASELLAATFTARLHHTTSTLGDGGPRPAGLALAAAHLFGVAVARYVLELPAIASMSRDELVRQLQPAIQRYLTTNTVTQRE